MVVWYHEPKFNRSLPSQNRQPYGPLIPSDGLLRIGYVKASSSNAALLTNGICRQSGDIHFLGTVQLGHLVSTMFSLVCLRREPLRDTRLLTQVFHPVGLTAQKPRLPSGSFHGRPKTMIEVQVIISQQYSFRGLIWSRFLSRGCQPRRIVSMIVPKGTLLICGRG